MEGSDCAKGMKVNIGKIKMIACGEGGGNEVSRVDPCGVCDKRVKANSVWKAWARVVNTGTAMVRTLGGRCVEAPTVW